MKLYIIDVYFNISNDLCYDKDHDLLVKNKEELDALDISRIDKVVLLSELKWSVSCHNMMAEMHYGIELLRTYLRAKKKILAPVLIISKYPESEILRSPRNYIINAVGQKFKRYNPFEKINTDNEFTSPYLKPLNQIQLNDLLNNYCCSSGQIGEIIHRAKGSISNIINNDSFCLKEKENKSVETLSSALDEIFTILPSIDSLYRFKSDLLSKFKKDIAENSVSAEIFLQKHEEMLRSLSYETENKSTPIAFEYPWKVLLLDDEPDSIRPIINALHSNGIRTIVCSHVDEAQKAIEEDEKNGNFISVIISDYRLFESDTTRHQSRQGYDFLLDTSKRDRFTSFVALSGLGRQFLLESFRKYNVRVEVYSKDDLRSSERARQVFAENIVQLGENQYDAICSQSTSEGWKKDGKKKFYIEHRQRLDYLQSEKMLSDDARRYINHFTYMHQKGGLIGHQPINDLQTSLEKKNFTDVNINIFRKILYARRLVLWLYHIVGLDSEAIYLLLTTGVLLNLQNRIDPEKVGNNTKQLMGKLCIKLTEYPNGILIDEKAWFKYQMDVDIDDLREVILQLQVHCEVILQKYPLFREKIIEWKCMQSNIEKNELIIVSIGDVKRLIRAIKENVKDGETAVIAYKIIEEMITSMLSDVAGEEHLFDVVKKGRECLAILKRRKS